MEPNKNSRAESVIFANVAGNYSIDLGGSAQDPAQPHPSLFARNENNQTPLSAAIRCGAKKSMASLLTAGAAASVFVHGPQPSSIVCTLPMATQPPSSVFVHPPPMNDVPPDVASAVDEALAAYVDSRHAIQQAAQEAKKEAAAVALNSTYDYYPTKLAVGDMVRRGPAWQPNNNDDMYGGKRHEGLVMAVGMGANRDVCRVNWFNDPQDPHGSAFTNECYPYDPTKNRTLFRVNPANRDGQPKDMIKPVLTPIVKFRQGDRVRLVEKEPVYTNNTNGFVLNQDQAKACLGSIRIGSGQRVGIVIGTTKKEGPVLKHQPFGKDTNYVVVVRSAVNGAICHYPSAELRFADGSPRKVDPGLFQPVSFGANNGGFRAFGARVFQVDDKVKLRSGARNQRGCLGEPAYNWVGRVTAFFDSEQVHVNCPTAGDGGGGAYPHLRGRYPNCSYSASDLILENESESMIPLAAGDRVELDDSYDANEGDGWCLGRAGAKKKGVVVLASPPTNGSDEQRNVGVVAIDDPSKMYWFRSSWLQRSINNGSTKFKVGDRVQLDRYNWEAGQGENSGKCLGSPSSGCYGIVCAAGEDRDGIDRNIEVVAACGDKVGEVSLYASYSLVEASRPLVLADRDVEALTVAIEQLLDEAGITAGVINVSRQIKDFGLDVWNKLAKICAPKISRAQMLVKQAAWQSECALEWETEDLMQSLRDAATGVRLPDEDNWYCTEAGGGKCNGMINKKEVYKCCACEADSPRWACAFCRTNNNCWRRSCITCYTNKADGAPNARQKLCRNFPDGKCRAGAQCRYVHPSAALRKLTEIFDRDTRVFHRPRIPNEPNEGDNGAGATSAAPGENSDIDAMEIEKNSWLSEEYFHRATKGSSSLDDLGQHDDPGSPSVARSVSAAYYGLQASGSTTVMKPLKPIDCAKELCAYKDKLGNTAAHYAASMHMEKSLEALVRAGASPWEENDNGDTPRSLACGFQSGGGRLHMALTRRGLLSSPELILAAARTPTTFDTPSELEQLRDTILAGDDEHNAVYLAEAAIHAGVPHADLYMALFYVQFQYSSAQAQMWVERYLDGVKVMKDASLDPLYYYVFFRLFKSFNGQQASYAVKDRLLAYDALKALRLYPAVADKWLDKGESFDADVETSGIIDTEVKEFADDDEYDDLFPPLGPDDPETLWENAKRSFGLESPSMDALMQLTGLKAVKMVAKNVCLSVLLDPPSDLDTGTSCNFTFEGNPGCGKTTVAELIAKAMVEIKYRTNPTPVLTSADEILGANQPPAVFAQMIKDAEGGTLFIDEAYLFDPSPKGKTQNDSNKVLNMLMKASDQLKRTTTFILAGYKEEMATLKAFNPGFPSRFPKTFTFEFADYTEAELTKILCDMTKKRNYRFENEKECGVKIARVLARRIHKGANSKGFGNARNCEKVLDMCIQKQMSRLVRLKENGVAISDQDYRTLLRKDTVGDRPKLQDSVHMMTLNSMIGLRTVKAQLTNLMNLQLQNYDAEMQGSRTQEISLHRVFYGSAGTGKTTVARLYGKMLKEFGFLSDGDIIETTPSDLTGVAVGEGKEKTRALLESAKGKVLFIDEAYNLDPERSSGSFGKEVMDVIVEKIDASAGSDMALVLAGYKSDMEQLFRNVNNEGLKRRLNLNEAFLFEDFTDSEIRQVLKRQIVKADFYMEPSTLDYAVELISQKRMESDFGNAGEAGQMLNRAKLRHSARLSAASVAGSAPVNRKLLLKEDFEGEVTSIEKARAAFDGLENIGHIMSLLSNLEAMCEVADSEGRPRHELLSDCNMLFIGPPGTGKTTMGKRFAIMFKQLRLLPTDRFEYVTAGNLIDRYMGGTSNNTIEAMRRAKGGILMIDEAYAMSPSRGGSYGKDIIQALLDNVTSEAFKGKIVVILGGYKEDVEELFSVNSGFQSRFDKKRVEFPKWNGKVASDAVKHAIERDGKTIEPDAVAAMTGYFNALSELPNWASARDALEWIKPSLDLARADRQAAVIKAKRELEDAKGGGSAAEGNKAPVLSTKSSLARGHMPAPLAYNVDDVRKVFTDAIRARGGEVDNETGAVSGVGSHEEGAVRKASSAVALRDLKSATKRASKLLVVCFTSPATCQPCVAYGVAFKQLAEAYGEHAVFATVDYALAPDMFENIDSFPRTQFFFNGNQLDDEVQGNNPGATMAIIQAHVSKQRKLKGNAPPPEQSAAPSGNQRAAPPKVIVRENYRTLKYDDDSDVGSGDDNEESTEDEVWAALEEACKEAGYKSLEEMRDMLADSSNFPPKDIMDLVLSRVRTKNPGSIKGMLSRQRPTVLSRVEKAIATEKAHKTAEEKKMQEKVQAIGKCPMGFAWHKEGEGWRCGGGSHYVSNEEIKKYMV